MSWATGAIEKALAKRCSGVAARWCDIHGDCECSVEEDFNDDKCPLHSCRSTHPWGRCACGEPANPSGRCTNCENMWNL